MRISCFSPPGSTPKKSAKIRPGSCLATSSQKSPSPRSMISSTISRAWSWIQSSSLRTLRGVNAVETIPRWRLCSSPSIARNDVVATWTTSGKSSITMPWPEMNVLESRETRRMSS
jgi:hypothetical protein